MGRWRRSGAEALLLIAAVLVGAGPLFGGLHYLEVGHYYCPEHHELVHLGSPPPPGFARGVVPGVAAEGGSSSRAGLPGHDHCGLQPFARHDAEPAPSLPTICASERVFEAVPAAAPDPMPPLEALAVAPKNSPPPALA